MKRKITFFLIFMLLATSCFATACGQNGYTITFVNHDGTELQTFQAESGVMPEFTKETPVRESTDEYDYTFSGWSPALTAATKDIKYTAEFTVY